MPTPRIRSRLLGVLAATALVSAVVAPPAQAKAPFTACNLSKILCAFWDANYEGGIMFALSEGQGLYNVYDNKNDAMSSIVNTSYSYRGAWYRDGNGTGTCYTIGSRQYASYRFVDGKNDSMSSMRFNRGC